MPEIWKRYLKLSVCHNQLHVATYALIARVQLLLCLLLLGDSGVQGQPLSEYRGGTVLELSSEYDFYPEFQDQLGYLWGKDSQGRPVRFDGYETEVYQSEPFDTSGLQCNGRTYLSEDSHGNIWFATGGCGLDRYDPETGRFERLHDAFQEARDAPAQYYWGIYEDSRQNIWIKAQRKLYRYKPENKDFTEVSPHWHLTALLEDSHGAIWALNPFVSIRFTKVEPIGGDSLEVVRFPYIGNPQEISRFSVTPVHAAIGGDVHLIVFGGNLYRFDISARHAEPLAEGLE